MGHYHHEPFFFLTHEGSARARQKKNASGDNDPSYADRGVLCLSPQGSLTDHGDIIIPVGKIT